MRFDKQADKMNHDPYVDRQSQNKSIIINQINYKLMQNIEIAAIWKMWVHKSWVLKFLKKGNA